MKLMFRLIKTIRVSIAEESNQNNMMKIKRDEMEKRKRYASGYWRTQDRSCI